MQNLHFNFLTKKGSRSMESNRMFLIATVLIALGVVGIITTSWFADYQNSNSWASSMMGGGMMGYGMMDQDMMRGMMNQMMPDLVPPGSTPKTYQIRTAKEPNSWPIIALPATTFPIHPCIPKRNGLGWPIEWFVAYRGCPGG